MTPHVPFMLPASVAVVVYAAILTAAAAEGTGFGPDDLKNLSAFSLLAFVIFLIAKPMTRIGWDLVTKSGEQAVAQTKTAEAMSNLADEIRTLTSTVLGSHEKILDRSAAIIEAQDGRARDAVSQMRNAILELRAPLNELKTQVAELKAALAAQAQILAALQTSIAAMMAVLQQRTAQ